MIQSRKFRFLALSLVIVTGLMVGHFSVVMAEDGGVTVPVTATHVSGSDDTTKVAATKDAEVKKEADAKSRCLMIQTKIAHAAGEQGKHFTNVVDKYQEIAAKLASISVRLAAQGVSVTQLNTDLSTFSTKITALNAAYTAFSTSVVSTTKTDCTTSDTDIKTSLAGSHDKLTALKTADQDIRNFYKTTLKQDIATARTALLTQSTTK